MTLYVDLPRPDMAMAGLGGIGAPWQVEARNTGNLALSLTELGLSAGSFIPDFEMTTNDCGTRTLQPGEHCNVAVRFSPHRPAPR